MKRLLPLPLLGLLVIGACSTTPESVAPTSTEVTTTAGAPTTTTSTITATTTTLPPTTTTTLAPLQGLEYQLVASLPFPVQVTARAGSDTAYVATKDGAVWAMVNGVVLLEPVLDIKQKVVNKGERGLLAIALHPEDPDRLFVHYSGSGSRTVVSEFTFLSPLAADPDTERILLEVGQPASNHNGGMIQFDSTGAMILGLGDGGGANDVFGNGQNSGNLLAGLVRIDVDSVESSLYTLGLRNPWRFWIDGGLVYIADVGQNQYEEISIVELEEGLNFGWPITEGLHCFKPSSGCDMTGLTLPQLEIVHGDAGTCSITGGLVYRGSGIPEIVGEYFYSDYCGGYLRSLTFADGVVRTQTDWTDQVGVPGQVTGFGHDGAGELYVTTTNQLFMVVPVR